MFPEVKNISVPMNRFIPTNIDPIISSLSIAIKNLMGFPALSVANIDVTLKATQLRDLILGDEEFVAGLVGGVRKRRGHLEGVLRLRLPTRALRGQRDNRGSTFWLG
jgi:hypothetical protein